MWRNMPEWREAQAKERRLCEEYLAPCVSIVESDVNYVPASSPIPLMDTGIIDRAIKTWGEEKQYTQFMEECGEAITEICHMFFRPDRTIPLDKLLEELVGVRIAVDHCMRLNQERCKEIYYDQIGKEIAAMDRADIHKGILASWGCPT
jgi:hypothetical protein